jgi:DNA-binding MarR family transcriptional regulator
MMEELESEGLSLKSFILLHRTRDLIFRCEERAVGEFGITMEQYTMILAMKYLDAPVRVTDIARWMARKANSVSMLVDRMVKAGLVKRSRALKDRREVRLVITSKGEQALELATPGVWKTIQELSSPLSDEDARTLIRLLESLRDKALEHLNPGKDARAIAAYETNEASRLLKRVDKYISK